jgi:hypothetical protein
MLIQMGIPRPRFDIQDHPEHLYIHTLARAGVSSGGVLFSGTVDPEHGVRKSRPLEPTQTYPIEGEDGFEGYEYILPFWELFQRKHVESQSTLARTGAKGYGSLGLVAYATNGFIVTAQSAFRASPTTYEGHSLAFTIMMPVTGGGILRLADCPFDISNPTFNPYAPNPMGLSKYTNLDTLEALNKAHKPTTAAIEARKAERIRAAEASMAARETPGLPPSRALPPKR